MPRTATDASKHTKRARTAAQRRRWASVASSVLRSTGDDARAIREANVVLARPARRRKPRSRRGG
jgi:hypothetical protein